MPSPRRLNWIASQTDTPPSKSPLQNPRFLMQTLRIPAVIACVALLSSPLAAEDEKPVRIEAHEARQHEGKKVEVVFEVKAAKFSMKRKAVFLDSELNFMDERNLGIAIVEKGLNDLSAQKGIGAPADHFRAKKIRVVGTVVIEDMRPYIKIEQADQIDLFKEDGTN